MLILCNPANRYNLLSPDIKLIFLFCLYIFSLSSHNIQFYLELCFSFLNLTRSKFFTTSLYYIFGKIISRWLSFFLNWNKFHWSLVLLLAQWFAWGMTLVMDSGRNIGHWCNWKKNLLFSRSLWSTLEINSFNGWEEGAYLQSMTGLGEKWRLGEP